MDITQLLAFAVKNKASDLHLSAGLPPMIRVHGDVRRINIDALDHKQVHDMVQQLGLDLRRGIEKLQRAFGQDAADIMVEVIDSFDKHLSVM
jgi:Tfp pilus assembly pilus retraction ATPase PilT